MTGNKALVEAAPDLLAKLGGLPAALAPSIAFADGSDAATLGAALIDGDATMVAALLAELADRPGPIVSVHIFGRGDDAAFPLDMLLQERSVSVNTAAAGGNASLMALN